MRLVLAFGTMVFAAATAQAAVADYCAAYARDEANRSATTATPEWQLQFDNADASCLLRFGAAAKPPLASKQRKPAVVPAKPKPLKAAAVNKPKAAAISPLQEPKTVLQLIAGSPEWIAYCSKKYVSFNASKGTYMSKTGVERKCLVTAE